MHGLFFVLKCEIISNVKGIVIQSALGLVVRHITDLKSSIAFSFTALVTDALLDVWKATFENNISPKCATLVPFSTLSTKSANCKTLYRAKKISKVDSQDSPLGAVA